MAVSRKISELEQLEARYAETEARKAHEQQIAAARSEYENARATYNELATAADEDATEVHAVTAKAAEVFARAVKSELARRQAGQSLEAAAQSLRDQEPEASISVPRVLPACYHDITEEQPVAGIRHAAVTAEPDLERLLDMLAGRRARATVRVQQGVRFGNRCDPSGRTT